MSRLPYVSLPELVLLREGALGPESPLLSLKPFGILVALGVYSGAWLALSYGVRRRLARSALASFIVWVVLSGFVFAHVLDVLWYSPERLGRDPWVLLRFWDGLSSYGGFVGGAFGALLWRQRHRTVMMPYADSVASALPVGWVFGRAGCAVVHDHPGIRSEHWLAVAYPDGSRLDLGLLELLVVIPIALGFLWLRRRAWPWGFFVASLSIVYAPVRFSLDFLRVREVVPSAGIDVADPRYFELTPAQWASLGLFVYGVGLLRVVLQNANEEAFTAPVPPEAFASKRRVASNTNA